MTENDDGSLANLGIPPDDSRKYFHCDETTQQKLTNKSFWVVDFIENVNTRYGSERYLVKIKFGTITQNYKHLKLKHHDS